MQPKVFLYVAIALTSVALLFQVIAVATTHWTEVALITFGLWRLCQLQYDERIKCFDIPLDTYGDPQQAQLQTVRAFAIIAIIAGAASLVAVILQLVKVSAKAGILKVASLVAIVLAVLSVMISVAIYPSMLNNRHYLSWSYDLSAAALAFFALGAVANAAYAVKARESDE